MSSNIENDLNVGTGLAVVLFLNSSGLIFLATISFVLIWDSNVSLIFKLLFEIFSLYSANKDTFSETLEVNITAGDHEPLERLLKSSKL